MGESRDVYVEIDERAVIRTADVYQTEVEAGTAGYSDTLLAVVANFKNSGAPEGFNAQCMVGKSKRGEVALRLFAVVDPATETFVRAGFKTRGCLAMTACASVVCSLIEGKTFAEALQITPDMVKDALDGVPWDKSYTTYFAAEGVRALVGDYLVHQGASLEQLDKQVPCDEFSVACAMCEHCSLRSARLEVRFGTVALRNEEADGEGSAGAVGAAGTAVAVDTNVQDSTAEEEAIASSFELSEQEALARVFNDVRAQSAESALVQPSRWEALGLVPEHLTSDEFEMFVYEYLEEERAEREKASAEAPAAVPVYRSATRAVGVPRLFDGAPEDSGEKDADAVNESGAATEQNGAVSEEFVQASLEGAPAGEGEPLAGFKVPEGYRLIELEGEQVLVPDESAEPQGPSINSENIVALVGAQSYYLYDSSIMTDTYAHWAFLAAEDDRVVTFVDCVREESRVYPRPLAASSLTNPPFNLSDDEVVQVWNVVQESGEYPDIQQTIASNDDVYYYSTEHLSPTYAASLAEWDAVERRLCL